MQTVRFYLLPYTSELTLEQEIKKLLSQSLNMPHNNPNAACKIAIRDHAVIRLFFQYGINQFNGFRQF
jgi:hypothetical protein